MNVFIKVPLLFTAGSSNDVINQLHTVKLEVDIYVSSQLTCTICQKCDCIELKHI
jgi:hypothetical protein